MEPGSFGGEENVEHDDVWLCKDIWRHYEWGGASFSFGPVLLTEFSLSSLIPASVDSFLCNVNWPLTSLDATMQTLRVALNAGLRQSQTRLAPKGTSLAAPRRWANVTFDRPPYNGPVTQNGPPRPSGITSMFRLAVQENSTEGGYEQGKTPKVMISWKDCDKMLHVLFLRPVLSFSTLKLQSVWFAFVSVPNHVHSLDVSV